MSKNIGIVAFRSSTSGMRVISRMGPTIPGIKQILFWPKTEWQIRYFRREREKKNVRKTFRAGSILKQRFSYLCW